MSIEIMDLDHDQISEQVRMNLAHRLTRLLDRFEIFLDDDPRDLSPGQVSNYLTAVKILGSLYQAHLRPVDKSGLVPAERVEKMIEAACAVAVEQALESERARIASAKVLELESAQSGVRAALERERARIERAS